MDRSGEYRYANATGVLPITETFSVSLKEDQWRLTTRRTLPNGAALLVEVIADGPNELLRERPLVVTEAGVSWFPPHEEEPSVSAIFRLENTSLLVERQRDGVIESLVREVGPHTVLSPLARITMGPTLIGLANQPGCDTIVPWFHDPTNAARLFEVQVEERTAGVAEPSSIVTPDGPVAGTTYRYSGGNYDGNDHFIVSDDGLLHAYTFNDMTIWRVDWA